MPDPNTFVHPTAVIDPQVRIGDGTKVWHFVHVCSGARIGVGCVLGQNVYVGPGVQLGDRVRVQNNVSIYEGVDVAADAFLGPSCVFTNVQNPRAEVTRRSEFGRTHVGVGATVGANATIVCGHALGEHCFVAAGAVVTRDVPPHALVMGVPARQSGWACTCGERLPEGEGTLVVCTRCERGYAITADSCREQVRG